MSIIETLKGRRLFQIVGSAAAAGWGGLEVVDQLASRGVVPEVLYYVALVLAIGGVLAAAVVGWFHGERGRQSVPRSEIMALSLLAVATLATTLFVTRRYQDASSPVQNPGVEARLSPHRVAIRYFVDESEDNSLQYLADGLTESLIYELSSVEPLDVLSQNASLRYRDANLADDSLATTLDVGTLVKGAIRPSGEGLEIEVGVVDGNTAQTIGKATFTTSSRDIVELRNTTAERVAAFLRERVGEEIDLQGLARETTVPEAWEEVLRAAEARKAFESAVDAGNVEALLAALATADSLLAHAENDDPSWPRPATDRAFLATRMAQLNEDDPLEAGEWIATGLGHVERALALDPDWPQALEERGALRYLRWHYGLERDPAAAPRLLQDAEADLTAAVSFDPTRARSYTLLSIIASQKPDLVRAKLNARRAYEEDAYLRAAENTVYRLFLTSYDLEDFADAVFYCNEGQRRFPDHPYFKECELWLRAAGAMDPDIDRAWSLVDLALATRPPAESERDLSKYRVIVGGVIAQAGLPDSARAVFERARLDTRTDPSRELLGHEAVFRLQMGDKAEALSLLQTYLTASPEHREGWQWTTHWWWRDLSNDPDFKALIGASD